MKKYYDGAIEAEQGTFFEKAFWGKALGTKDFQGKMIGNTIREIRNKNAIPNENFCRELSSTLTKKLEEPISQTKVKNYLYSKTPWPTMSCDLCIEIITDTLKKCWGGPDSVELDSALKHAKKHIINIYVALSMDTTPAIETGLLCLANALFFSMDNLRAYIFIDSLTACSSLTENDIKFLNKIHTMQEEKRAQLLSNYSLRKMTLEAGNLLEFLISQEMAEWHQMMYRNYSDGFRKSSRWNIADEWNELELKLKSMDLWQVSALVDVMLLCIEDGRKKRLFEKSEIRLLILFKYCLTEEVQEEILVY